MSIQNTLAPILERELPKSAENAIKGTHLAKRIESQVIASTNSLLQAFCAMAKNPASPIAKVESGQGYYRRPESQKAIEPQKARAIRQLALMAVSMKDHFRSLTGTTPTGEWNAQMSEYCAVVDKLEEGAK